MRSSPSPVDCLLLELPRVEERDGRGLECRVVRGCWWSNDEVWRVGEGSWLRDGDGGRERGGRARGGCQGSKWGVGVEV